MHRQKNQATSAEAAWFVLSIKFYQQYAALITKIKFIDAGRYKANSP